MPPAINRFPRLPTAPSVLLYALLLGFTASVAGCDSAGDETAVRIRGIEDGGVYTERRHVEVVADPDEFSHVNLGIFVADSLAGMWQREAPPFVFEGFPFLDAFFGAGEIEVEACAHYIVMRDVHAECSARVRVRFVEP